MEIIEDIIKLNEENEWFKPKHISMYKDFTFRAAQESYAIRRKAGAVAMSPRGSLFIGYNGTPINEDNCCEDGNFTTKDNVIHAEDNAIRKMNNEGISPSGSIMFITDSPCVSCVRNVIIKNDIKAVFYFRYYTDTTPLNLLTEHGIVHHYVDDNTIELIRKHFIYP